MNKNAEVWVKALQSGKYIQTTGALSKVFEDPKGTQVTYCCLGVACDIYNKFLISEGKSDRWGTPFTLEGTDGKLVGYMDNGKDEDIQESILPREVAQWLGLASQAGTYFSSSIKNLIEGEASLIDLNDAGIEFGELADFIASEPEGLFDTQGELYLRDDLANRIPSNV